MRRYGITHLRLNTPTERQVNIDFLTELTFLERADLSALSVRDVTPLYGLPKLRRLTITGIRQEIDFTRLARLEELRVDWNAKFFSSFLSCDRLRILGIGNYNCPDLRQLGNLRSLEELILSLSRIETLAGVEHFPELERLSLDFVKHLETLEPLGACRMLRYLSIDDAKNLKQIDPVAHLVNLQELCLKRCPEVDSLKPVKGFGALEYVGLLETTNIQDGDLSVLLTLPNLKHASFVDRKHYSHKNADFPKVYRVPNKLVVLYDNSVSAPVSGRVH
jgi:Leucine-rich repeat (LRR) protein